MWTCKFCKFQFDFLTTSEKANHSRWCKSKLRRMIKYACEKCNREFTTKAGLGNHKKVCDGTPCAVYVRWLCPKCNHHIHSQRERHIEICDGLGPGVHKRAVQKNTLRPWNKGLKLPEGIGKKISKALTGRQRKPLSVESEIKWRRKISETAKKNKKSGGYRKGSGRGKGGWHDSHIAGRVYLDSTYELRLAKCLDSMNIQWERNKEKFYYEHEGKSHNYIPDFKIADFFIEVKGFVTERDKSKWKYFPHKLVIIYESDITNLESGVLPKWS